MFVNYSCKNPAYTSISFQPAKGVCSPANFLLLILIAKAEWVCQADRIIVDISIKVTTAAREPNRVFGDEPANCRIIIP